jgi:hypothetical protein
MSLMHMTLRSRRMRLLTDRRAEGYQRDEILYNSVGKVAVSVIYCNIQIEHMENLPRIHSSRDSRCAFVGWWGSKPRSARWITFCRARSCTCDTLKMNGCISHIDYVVYDSNTVPRSSEDRGAIGIWVVEHERNSSRLNCVI